MNKLLNERIINTLNAFQLTAKEIVEGFMVGLHKSPYHGYSVEFADYRQYIPGDQIKDIDWKIYAKTDRYYVRQFEDETNLRAYIIIDHSNSMKFSSGKISKLSYAKLLAGSLTYLISKQSDAVGLVSFNEDISYMQSPRAHRGYISAIYKKIYELEADGKTDGLKVLHKIAEKIKKRSLIIVISDLLGNSNDVMNNARELVSSLKHFRFQKHEVLVFHIVDEQEKAFNYKNETLFIDSETGDKITVEPWQIRETVQNNYQNYYSQIKQDCLKAKIEYIPMTTTVPIEDNLLSYLVKRSKI